MSTIASPGGMTGRTAQGAAWLVGSRLVTRGVDFILLLVLGRLLGPAEFGIIAIAMTLITVVEAVMDLPLAQSLIRISHLTQAHLDTAFTLGMLRGAALALLLSGLAWPFAHFYDDARLVPLICALALAPVARGLSSPAMAVYAREISFHRDFLVEIAGKLTSFCVAIALASLAQGYWALVASTIVTPISTALISYRVAPYRPRLSLSEWPSFAAFLGWSSAAQALSAINWQCDRFLISRFMSQAVLGRFSMANDLSVLPVQALLIPLLRPLTAAFALLKDERERLGAAYLRATNALVTIGTPLMMGLSALAEPAVRLVLGPRWTGAEEILRWLSLATLPNMYVIPLGALAMSLGRTRIFFKLALIEFSAKIPLVVAGAMLAGIHGVVQARIASALIMACVAMIFARELCGIGILRQALGSWRPLISGTVMYLGLLVFGSVAGNRHDAVGMAVSLSEAIVAGAALYTGTLFLLWRLCHRPEGVETMAIVFAIRLINGLRARHAVAS